MKSGGSGSSPSKSRPLAKLFVGVSTLILLVRKIFLALRPAPMQPVISNASNTNTLSSSVERDAMLISLHVAEYQTMTTRCTYWITMQFALMPVIPIYLTLVAPLWLKPDYNKGLLFWGSAFVLQIVGHVWNQTLGDQYATILYIERVLRPAIEKVLDSREFWFYEPYLARLRKARVSSVTTPEIWEFMIVALSTVLMLSIVVYVSQSEGRFLLSGYGWLGLLINLLFLVFQWVKTFEVRNMRHQFSVEAAKTKVLVQG
jgi:hypothetical protein